ncbi:MAG: nucleotide exchange factor GrpE [Fidelibacterota bacterium]|nr:MAG: nucleotide exchange factor GrpE [Candidatus Neomarinimicrobiota bacterium]
MKSEADQSQTNSAVSAGGAEEAQDKPVRSKDKAKPGRSPADARKIKELEASFKELEDKYIRLRAEYDNHIKRTSKEKSELITYAGTQVFRLTLPILDDLYRTVEHARQDETQKDDPIVQGVALIADKFAKVLEAEGIQVFSSVGEEFDPELHEALMTRPSNEQPAGIVLEEYEPGYKYRDKVIRHAKVVVSG